MAREAPWLAVVLAVVAVCVTAASAHAAQDVFLHGSGAAPDEMLFSEGRATFAPRATDVPGTYQPLAGDLDGDGFDDVLWYGPGDAPDSSWYGSANGTFTFVGASVRTTSGTARGEGWVHALRRHAPHRWRVRLRGATFEVRVARRGRLGALQDLPCRIEAALARTFRLLPRAGPRLVLSLGQLMW